MNSIAVENDREERQRLKKSLPGITWQAHFPNGNRKNDEAEPSGLYMVDVDHVEQPFEVWQSLCGRVEELKIMAAHMTPSTKGIRVVCVCQEGKPSIEENQKWFAEQTGLEIDAACKDLARFSYLVTRSYFYYFDGRIFDEDFKIENQIVRTKSDEITEKTLVSESETSEEEEADTTPTTYKGLELTAIARKWLELQNGGLPEEGERNTVLFQLATRMRYICEFKYTRVARCIPDCGLPQEELLALCKSACNTQRMNKMPYDLKIVVNQLKKEQEPIPEEEMEENLAYNPHDEEFLLRMPHLPIGLRDSILDKPDKTKMPILAGILPLAEAYATNVRVRYCDGKIHRLNGMSIIVGNQASGKSAVSDVVKIWKRQMAKLDKYERDREDEYKAFKKKRKQSERLPDEPAGVVRTVPITISCSTLLKRFKRSCGKHLYSFGEELDTLYKTNGAGSWSSKYDIYRLSFDNGEWGQDYNSDNAESGVVNVAYNWSIMGTKGAVDKCFRSDSVENGMSGRVLFARLPESKYEYIPVYDPESEYLDKADVEELADENLTLPQRNMIQASKYLADCAGFYDTPKLRKTIVAWVNHKADVAKEEGSVALDTFRKRSAVIAFRAAVVYMLLENCEKNGTVGGMFELKESKAALDFAELMADYCLKYQMELFADMFTQVANVQKAENFKNKITSLYDELPDRFTIQMAMKLRPEARYQALATSFHRWTKIGIARRLKQGFYLKTSGEGTAHAKNRFAYEIGCALRNRSSAPYEIASLTNAPAHALGEP